MLSSPLVYAASALVFVGTVLAHEGLHLATQGLLQIPPSFSGKSIALYPAHHPDHNATDLEHLTPKLAHELYYAQEGHRPALHGAKHGTFKANFSLPTVVLDHSSHLTSIECRPGSIQACFQSDAYQHVLAEWQQQQQQQAVGSSGVAMHILTYHVGCGDETSGKRSVFLATDARFDAGSQCVSVKASLVEKDEDALTAGEISWGTYTHPLQKRTPVKGHVRVSKPLAATMVAAQNHDDDDDDSQRLANVTAARAAYMAEVHALAAAAAADDDDDDDDDDGGGGEDDDEEEDSSVSEPLDVAEEEPVGDADLTQDVDALFDFFGGSDDIDGSKIHDPAPTEDDLDFIHEDGEVGDEDEEDLTEQPQQRRRRRVRRRQSTLAAARRQRAALEKRGVVDFFWGIWQGTVKVVKAVGDFIRLAVSIVVKVANVLAEVAIMTAKIIAVPFGVPFDHTYHHDFNFTHKLKGEGTNKPPPVFDYGEGFNLAASSKIINVPLTIPGIITLGPKLAISTALDLVLNGKGELLVGGSLVIAKGEAALSVVRKRDNKFTGFKTMFTPVNKFTGTLTASMELGLPISLDVGLDVLNGKFKKTVGLVNKPLVYISAAASNDPLVPCHDGIELRAGVKNRIFVRALDEWDYDIRTDTLYKKLITCVRTASPGNAVTLPDPLVFNHITRENGIDVSEVKPPLDNVAANLMRNHPAGFRVIMDEDKSLILVARTDGFLYLVPTKDQYNRPDRKKGYVSEVQLFEPNKIPKRSKAGALFELKQPGKPHGNYGVFMQTPSGDYSIFYTTFCRVRGKGLRLIPTRFSVKKDGTVMGLRIQKVANNMRTFDGLIGLGVFPDDVRKTCRTVRLTSALS